MTLHFACTLCGQCCHNLKLPLTVAEAAAWLQNGHQVQVLCEAVPWPGEPDPLDALAQHRRRRSFASHSGNLAVRVVVVLAASFDGACPHLRDDQRCGNYEHRPMVCRIYPAEIRPGLTLQPAHKACPPESWSSEQPIYIRNGQVADPDLRALIQRSRDSDAADVPVKERLCAALGLSAAGLGDEGWVIHSPDTAALLRELRRASAADAPAQPAGVWELWSNRRPTVDELGRCGAASAWVDPNARPPWEYRGLYPSSA